PSADSSPDRDRCKDFGRPSHLARPGGVSMRAAVLTEYNQPLVIEDLEDPPLGPRDVRVQIDASGVCHSDLTVQTGGVPMPVPIILGHEGAGTVLEVGKEVSRVKAGDQ